MCVRELRPRCADTRQIINGNTVVYTGTLYGNSSDPNYPGLDPDQTAFNATFTQGQNSIVAMCVSPGDAGADVAAAPAGSMSDLQVSSRLALLRFVGSD